MQRPVRSFAAVTGQTRPIKVMINIGACLDFITGRYIIGSHGEHILNRHRLSASAQSKRNRGSRSHGAARAHSRANRRIEPEAANIIRASRK